MLSARLSRKFLAGLGLAVCLASLVFLVLFIESYRGRIGDERARASEQVNRLLQVSLENAMLKRDLPGLQDIVTRLGELPGVENVRIINPDREIRFASDPLDLHERLSRADLGCSECGDRLDSMLAASTQLVTEPDGSEVLRSVTPIRNRAPCEQCHGSSAVHPVNGVLVVDHDAAGIRHEALRAAAAMSGAGLLVVLVALGTVWLVLKRVVLSPVLALDAATRSLSAGDLRARAPLSLTRGDELQDLCRSFNTMADTIESSVAEIRDKEAFLKTLIDTVPDGVRVIDETYTVVMANQAYARQNGGERACLIGVPCHRIHGLSEPCPPTLVTCPFHAIRNDGEPIRYIHRHVRQDGGEINVETTAARLTIEKDGIRKVLIIEAIRDLEQQVKYSHEQRLSEIGQLAAGVAHEVYNPLASVRLGLQAMLRRAKSREGLDPEMLRYLALVEGEIDKCIGVTKRLLDLSQAPSTSLQLVSLSSIVPEVVSLLRFEAEKTKVDISLALEDDDLRVLATDAELRMLVLNLVQNAFHAMPAGGTLTIQGRRQNGEVSLVVTDTGVGIDSEALPHIFEPFFSKRADGVAGTGLGLTICKAIVTRYGGRIGVESRPGEGTRMNVVLPHASSAGTKS